MLYKYLPITDIYAREILDSRGNPTVEVEVTVEGKYTGRASVPSGASTGKYEAVELRDGESRYLGLGVKKAVRNVNDKLFGILAGENALEQRNIDHILLDADGTANKENMGANALLGVSMAVARASALALALPLYRYLGGVHAHKLPIPMMNILNGGRHADNTVDFQEFMIMPVSACCFKEGLRMCSEIYQKLKVLLKKQKLSTGVGDEGGFAPDLPNTKEVLMLLMEAIRQAGYLPGEQIKIAIDVAASELYEEKKGMYEFPGESSMNGKKILRDTSQLIDYYEELVADYPIASIEDGLDEKDWEGWKSLTERLGGKIQLVGDDLFVTNPKRLALGIQMKCANAILVKVNQIGTLTEAMEAIEMAKRAGFGTIISHRSGETADDFIADLAVAVNGGQIKTGAPCRMDRVEKYNELLRIEETLC